MSSPLTPTALLANLEKPASPKAEKPYFASTLRKTTSAFENQKPRSKTEDMQSSRISLHEKGWNFSPARVDIIKDKLSCLLDYDFHKNQVVNIPQKKSIRRENSTLHNLTTACKESKKALDKAISHQKSFVFIKKVKNPTTQNLLTPTKAQEAAIREWEMAKGVVREQVTFPQILTLH